MGTLEQEKALLAELGKWTDGADIQTWEGYGGVIAGRIGFWADARFDWTREHREQLFAIGYEQISPVLIGKTFDGNEANPVEEVGYRAVQGDNGQWRVERETERRPSRLGAVTRRHARNNPRICLARSR